MIKSIKANFSCFKSMSVCIISLYKKMEPIPMHKPVESLIASYILSKISRTFYKEFQILKTTVLSLILFTGFKVLA